MMLETGALYVAFVVRKLGISTVSDVLSCRWCELGISTASDAVKQFNRRPTDVDVTLLMSGTLILPTFDLCYCEACQSWSA